MERQIELGRAVLASNLHNLELWLTCLITFSPVQHSINIQQFTNSELLDLLTSDDFWVSRGSGLYMDVAITSRGSPLPEEHLLQLAERLVKAPVWQHLKLRPSLPFDGNPAHTIRICISHHEAFGEVKDKERHRVFANVPPSDIKPPDSVPGLELRAIHLGMDILEARPRPPLKRSRPVPKTQKSKSSLSPKVVADELLNTSHELAQNLQASSIRIVVDTDPHMNDVGAFCDQEGDLIGIMIDGALRVASCGGLSTRQSTGLKVKANSFTRNLADVVPNLWKAGHLEAISRRACLLPTISRSLSHLSSASISSPILRSKIRELETNSARINLVYSQDGTCRTVAHEPMTSSIPRQMWLHLQRNIASKTSSILPAFVAPISQGPPGSAENDMLALGDDSDREQWPVEYASTLTNARDLFIDSEDDRPSTNAGGDTKSRTDCAMTSGFANQDGVACLVTKGHALREKLSASAYARETASSRDTAEEDVGLWTETSLGPLWEHGINIPPYSSAGPRTMQHNELLSYDEGREDRSESGEDILTAI